MKIGVPIFDFTGHLGDILAICYTKNGKIIYAVNDQSIRIFDTEKKKTIRVLHSINLRTYFLQISHDEKYIISGDPDGYIELWDLTNYSRLDRISAFTLKLTELVWAGQENTIVASGVSQAHLVRKYRLSKLQKLEIDGEFDVEDKVKYLGITEKDGSILVMIENTILVLKYKNLKLSEEIEFDDFIKMRLSEEGRSIVAINKTGAIQIWQEKKLKVIEEIQIPMKEFPNGILFIQYLEGKEMLVYGDHHKLHLWSMKSKSLVLEIKSTKSKGTEDQILCIAFNRLNDHLIIGGTEKLRILELETGKTLHSVGRTPKSPPYYQNFQVCQISDDQGFLIGVRKLVEKTEIKNIIEVWNISKNIQIHQILPEMNSENMVTSLEISPDSKFFITGDNSKNANGIIWNLKTGKLRKKLKELDYGVNSITISNDGSKIITSDAAFDIEVFDEKGKFLMKMSASTKHVTCFALNHDDTILVCAFRDVMDRDYDVQVWDFESGRLITQLSAGIEFEDKIIWVGFSSDQKYLYSKSIMGTMTTWEVKNWKLRNKVPQLNEHPFEPVETKTFAYPFAENIILNISDDRKSAIKEFLTLWSKKPIWVVSSKDSYCLASELNESQIESINSQINSFTD